MKQLQLFYKEERRFFFSLFLLMLVQSFGTLLLPYFLAKIIDEGILKVDTTAIWHNGWVDVCHCHRHRDRLCRR